MSDCLQISEDRFTELDKLNLVNILTVVWLQEPIFATGQAAS